MVNRTVIEVVIGVFYALGAGTQALWVLWHSEKFYRDMADRAWLPPAEAFIEGVLIPNSAAVTVLVAVFEAGAAIAIQGSRSWSGTRSRWNLLDRWRIDRQPRRDSLLRHARRRPLLARRCSLGW